jgi:hypothetical protein
VPRRQKETQIHQQHQQQDKKVDTHPALFTLQQLSYPLEESMPNQPE